MSGYAPDGSPVAVYLRVPGALEVEMIHSELSPAASILELGCGAGRLTNELVALGHPVTAVDNSPQMLSHVHGAETVLADIVGLQLDQTFDAVLLWSHLIHAMPPVRDEFLATCRRHVGAGGCVLLLRHEPGWVRTVSAGRLGERDGVAQELTSVEHDGDRLRATIAWEFDGERYEQSFEIVDVDAETLEAAAAEHGLRVVQYLGEGRMIARLEPV